MTVTLQKLSIEDGIAIYDMLKELPGEENGFLNGCHDKTYEEYKAWLIASDHAASGIDLPDWKVPQTVYWLYVDGLPVGMAKLKARLTPQLMEVGGHAGYAVRPSQRNRGYGKLLLRLLKNEARNIGIERMLLTVQNHNTPSIQVALANGGVVERVTAERHYIWIDCATPAPI